MARPRAMYIETGEQIVAHYGVAKQIVGLINDPEFGIQETHFKHPVRGYVFSFRETEKPVVYDNRKGIIRKLRMDADKRKIQIFQPEQIYAKEHLMMFVYSKFGNLCRYCNVES